MKQFKPIKFQNLGVEDRSMFKSNRYTFNSFKYHFRQKYTLNSPEDSVDRNYTPEKHSKNLKLISKIVSFQTSYRL